MIPIEVLANHFADACDTLRVVVRTYPDEPTFAHGWLARMALIVDLLEELDGNDEDLDAEPTTAAGRLAVELRKQRSALVAELAIRPHLS